MLRASALPSGERSPQSFLNLTRANTHVILSREDGEGSPARSRMPLRVCAISYEVTASARTGAVRRAFHEGVRSFARCAAQDDGAFVAPRSKERRTRHAR